MHWPILDELCESDRARVLAATSSRRYARDETLVRQGEPGTAFHLVASGRVAVRVTTATGEVVTLSVLGPGDFFGEQALLGPRHQRTASVVALEPVETRSMDSATFDQLRRAYPSVEHFLVEVLAAQVRRLTAHLVEALYVPAEQRTLRRLLELLRQYRSREETWTVPVTQQDLAAMAGTTRPTVNRVLRGMEEAGVLRLERGRIVVLDLDALRRRAHAPSASGPALNGHAVVSSRAQTPGVRRDTITAPADTQEARMSEIPTSDELDDVEGHRMKRPSVDEARGDDVEGHRMKRPSLEGEDAEDDVEGHRMKRP